VYIKKIDVHVFVFVLKKSRKKIYKFFKNMLDFFLYPG